MRNMAIRNVVAILVLLVLGGAGCKGGEGTPAGSGGAAVGTGGATAPGTGGVSTGTGGAPAGTGGAAVGTGGTAAGTGGAAPMTNDLGKACAADTDCGAPLFCLKATDGPPNGYCTSACVPNDGKCQMVGGVCYNLLRTTATYCSRSCTTGGTDRIGKCHGRADVACAATSNGAACLPTCSQDSACPSGHRCDLQTGQCSASPPTGDVLGTHCVPSGADGGTPTCAGVCLTLGTATPPTATFCTARCVLGELNGCGWVGQGMSLAGGGHGVCAWSSAGAGPGDEGYCAEICDSVADCHDQVDPGLMCNKNIDTAIGHGACMWTRPAADGGGQ